MKPSDFEVEHGPVLKNRSTKLFETILESLATHGIDSISYQLNQFNEYELSYNDDHNEIKTVNLTILLQTADLSHLLLSDPLIEKLGVLLETQREAANTSSPIFKEKAQEFFETAAGVILRKAIYYYTLASSSDTESHPPFYLEANALFRGLPLDSNSPPRSGYDSVVFSLIMVSLVAYACNRLPTELTKEELQDTAEKLQGKPVLRTVYFDEAAGNVNRPKKLSSLTSTTHNKDRFGDYRFFIQNPPSLLPNIAHSSAYPKENEIIIPPGYQIVYEPKIGSQADAYLISIPMADNYWPRHALRFCFQKYLSKDYQDSSDLMKIGDIPVARPNHGLAHTNRVCSLIEPVIKYFSLFASNLKFRKFCTEITEDELTLLKLSAVFSVSGRESEVSFSDDLARYTQYRVNSKNYFLEYVKQFPECVQSVDKNSNFERMGEIIQFMSNPNYPTKLNTAVGDEQEKRNYLHWILSMAHKLDLPRCYIASEYQNAIEPYNTELVEKSERQEAVWEALQDYAIAMIEAHGDALCCRFNADSLFDCFIPYDPTFGEISNSPNTTEAASASVEVINMELIMDKKPRLKREVTRYLTTSTTDETNTMSMLSHFPGLIKMMEHINFGLSPQQLADIFMSSLNSTGSELPKESSSEQAELTSIVSKHQEQLTNLTKLNIRLTAVPGDIKAIFERIRLLSKTDPRSCQLLYDCNSILKKHPDNIMVLLERAAFYERIGLFGEKDELALKDYKHVLEIEPGNQKAQEGVERISPCLSLIRDLHYS